MGREGGGMRKAPCWRGVQEIEVTGELKMIEWAGSVDATFDTT